MLTSAQKDFLAGRIYAIKARLDKAQRRIEKDGNDNPSQGGEALRSKRLSKVLELHLTNPEEALTLYK